MSLAFAGSRLANGIGGNEVPMDLAALNFPQRPRLRLDQMAPLAAPEGHSTIESNR
jgi:hypothetical protein